MSDQNPPRFEPPRRPRPRSDDGPPPIVVGRDDQPATRRLPADSPDAPRRRTTRPEGGRPDGARSGGTRSDAARSGQPAPQRPAQRPPSVAPRRPGTAPAGGGVPPRGPRSVARDDHGGPRPAAPPRRRSRARRGVVVLVLLLALLLAWPIGLVTWANGRLTTVDALSGAESTPGSTYLLAGSDVRDGEVVKQDSTTGERTDTIMLLHVPSSGPTALLSLPRDTYAEIPGHGGNKLNAAYSFGGPGLLVTTVENLTGFTVDHYVEVGFAGVAGVVDTLGGVELCLDQDVDDEKSHLQWEAGCHVADGETALAFARMRYSDPEGDIGRAGRQQQLLKAIAGEAANVGTLVNPAEQVGLVRAGTDALVVSDGTGVIDLGRLALAFRDATGDGGVTGTPWIASGDHRPGGVGSTVLLDDERNAELYRSIMDGSIEPGEVGGLPG